MAQPRTRWLCHILKDIMKHGKKWQDTEGLWAERRDWRLLTHIKQKLC
jgi:hypothetical protein